MRNRRQEKLVQGLMVLIVPCMALLFSAPFARSAVPVPAGNPARKAIPRMVDLGRNQCTPCKMMGPVLEELRREYTGVIDVEFINIAEDPEAMTRLGLPVRAVPFQVFYDASGKIVKRHYGYMSKEEILKAFKDLGFNRMTAQTPGR